MRASERATRTTTTRFDGAIVCAVIIVRHFQIIMGKRKERKAKQADGSLDCLSKCLCVCVLVSGKKAAKEQPFSVLVVADDGNDAASTTTTTEALRRRRLAFSSVSSSLWSTFYSATASVVAQLSLPSFAFQINGRKSLCCLFNSSNFQFTQFNFDPLTETKPRSD